MSLGSFMPRTVGPVLTVAACLIAWLVYDRLDWLRGTPLWDLRYVALACILAALFSVVDRMSAFVARWLNDH